MKKRKIGTLSIVLGCLLVGCALFLALRQTKQELERSTIAVQTISEFEKGEIDPNYIGVLQIPHLELNLPVQASYSQQALDLAPCLYSNKEGHTIICAHNANDHFGHLDQLVFGDPIYLDTGKNRYMYEVEQIERLQPTEVDRMLDTDYALTLFTCTYLGKERVTIRARLCEVIEKGQTPEKDVEI